MRIVSIILASLSFLSAASISRASGLPSRVMSYDLCHDEFANGSSYIMRRGAYSAREHEPALDVAPDQRRGLVTARQAIRREQSGAAYAEAIISFLRIVAPGRFDAFTVEDVLGAQDSDLAREARELLAMDLRRIGNVGWIKLSDVHWNVDSANQKATVKFNIGLQEESPYRIAGQAVVAPLSAVRLHYRTLHASLTQPMRIPSASVPVELFTESGELVRQTVELEGRPEDHLQILMFVGQQLLATGWIWNETSDRSFYERQ